MHFFPTDKETWLKQIHKEWTNPPDEWWPGESIDPTVTSTSKVVLPSGFFNRPPKWAEIVNLHVNRKVDISHDQIMTSLEQGSEIIQINPGGKEYAEWKSILQNVDRSMVEVSILDETFPITEPGIKTEKPLSRSGDEGNPDHSLFTVVVPRVHSNWIADSARIYDQIITAKCDWEKQNEGSLPLRVYVPDDEFYFRQIIHLRVWQVLLLNAGLTNGSVIQLHLSRRENESPDDYLIRSSASVLAGFMTGVASISSEIDPENVLGSHYHRANRNLNALLWMEGNMVHNMDPIAGSYIFDHYTAKWSEMISSASELTNS